MPMYKNYFFDLYGTLVDIRGADSIGMKSRYIHSWQSPPRGFSLPKSCREIQSLESLLKDC